MRSGVPEGLEELLSGARLHEAARLVRGARPERPGSLGARRAAAVLALGGYERETLRLADPVLVGAGEAGAAEYGRSLPGGAQSDDWLVLAVAAAARGAAESTLSAFDRARDCALAEGRPHVAAAALGRRARHGLLFGDLPGARAAADEALDLARRVGLAAWRRRAAAARARLAVDFDEPQLAGELLEESAETSPEFRALFAPAGAGLAVQTADAEALRFWSDGSIVEAALYSADAEVAIFATTALVHAAATDGLDEPACLALARALHTLDEPAEAVELLAQAARRGTREQSRLATDVLQTVALPQRRYVEAQLLLARAHRLLHEGERAAAIDCAGDAARLFDAIGMRRWTNEAMLLMVRQDGGEHVARRRPTAVSLTRREQQVAQLIRRGASNREVARTLQISEHTVERHVSSILSRLGLRSRWQIVDARSAAES